MRYASLNGARSRRDANEETILAVIKRLGGHFLYGPPLDGWAWHPRRARYFPVEIKTEEREGTIREFTSRQRQFFAWADANRAPYVVLRSRQDAMRFMQ